MPENLREWFVQPNEAGARLDRFLTEKNPDFSRSRLAHLIEEDAVQVNRQIKPPHYRVKRDDSIRLVVPPPESTEVVPENIPVDIIYEDADIIVVDKPPGMLTHPVPGRYRGTLVNALLAHCKDLQGIGGELRPGIVHRLDHDTSGVMVVAKNERSQRILMQQFKNRQVKKTYVALVYGVPKHREGFIELPIGRSLANRQKMAAFAHRPDRGNVKVREAKTGYRVVEAWKDFALLEIFPETGRTHQIRVHLSNMGHPIVGDTTYTRRKPPEWAPRQMLHAKAIEFRHPTSDEIVSYAAPLPVDFLRAIRKVDTSRA